MIVSHSVAQLVAVLVTAIAQVGIQEALFARITDICTPDQSAHLTCPHTEVFYSSSAIWYVPQSPPTSLCCERVCSWWILLFLFSSIRGVIGPTRQFGAHALYKPELYAILIGAFLPIPFWLWQRRYPRTWLSNVSTPVLLNGPCYIPPALGINYSSWFVVAFLFRKWLSFTSWCDRSLMVSY